MHVSVAVTYGWYTAQVSNWTVGLGDYLRGSNLRSSMTVAYASLVPFGSSDCREKHRFRRSRREDSGKLSPMGHDRMPFQCFALEPIRDLPGRGLFLIHQDLDPL